MKFNIHDAKTQFSKLVAAVEAGERVTICRNGTPIMDCVPAEPMGPFPFGLWSDMKMKGSLDHLAEPTDEALLDEMGL